MAMKIGEVRIGEPCILELESGATVRTSVVENWYKSCTGDMVIYTKNSIYRHYN